jgi:alpha-glucosidase (family GH31 glycosyl hydrolase)
MVGCIGKRKGQHSRLDFYPGYIGSFYVLTPKEHANCFGNSLSKNYIPLGFDAWWMDASNQISKTIPI